MTSIVKADDGIASGSAGLKSTADSSGTLELQATSGVVTAANVTGGFVVPTGTTAQRPGTPAVGTERWNTTLGSLEIYNGTAWGSVGGGGAGSYQAVQTTGFTAVAGNAYACNTTSAAFTVTLPAAPTAGACITLFDYAGTWGTNPVTLNPNGLKINASTSNVVLSTNRQGVSIIYADATQGWVCYSQGATIGPYSVSYLAVAGGAGGGGQSNGSGSGGGGAGGLITSTTTLSPGTAYTITIGAGGSPNTNGSNSSLGAIATAIGGGTGGSATGTNQGRTGFAGGSGGGAGYWDFNGTAAGGAGTSGQGNSGGSSTGNGAAGSGGGGGGAGGSGGNSNQGTAGNGGIGVQSSISGTNIYYAGGGGGSGQASQGTGGAGGGGNGGGSSTGTNGTANLGGGGGGNATGGSGVVIISYPGTQRGTGGTVTSSGGNTIHTFISSGTYTA